jgi:hypothetical protein
VGWQVWTHNHSPTLSNAVKSQESRRTYSGHIVRFLRYVGFQSTDELIKLTGQEIEQKIISYIVHMVKNKLSTGTIDTFCGAIFTFYEMNDIIAINKKKIKKYIPEKQKKFRDRAYTHQEISKLLNTSDLRFRAQHKRHDKRSEEGYSKTRSERW